jgi:hypothetical protein
LGSATIVTGRVLRANIMAWSRVDPDRADDFRQRLIRLFRKIPLELEERIRRASYPDLDRWERRIRYAPDLESIFDSLWRLPVELLSQADLLGAAIASPTRSWTLAIYLKQDRRADHDRFLVAHHVPWFLDLPSPASTLAELRRTGLAVLIGDDEALSRHLFRAIDQSNRDHRLTASLFTPEGRIAF